MAGVIAARTLYENGVKDFVLVEAESDLGGRMKHTKFAGYTIELGANWIQGTTNTEADKENPILVLAKKYNLLNVASNYDDLSTYDENGYTDYRDVQKRYDDIFTKVLEDAGTRLKRNLADLSFDQGQLLNAWKAQTPHEKVAEYFTFDYEYADTPAASSMIEAAVNYNETYIQWNEENLLCIDQRGFNVLVRNEAKTFSTNKNIMYNSIVKKVTYCDKSVVILLKDNTVITAEYAICTFSLGVLQNQDVEFVPSFPAWKQEAIFSFKMATYTKIFLKFPYKFWNNTQFTLYADRCTRGYYPIWQSLSEAGFFPNSNITFVTIVTDQSYIVEAKSNNQTLNEIMSVLRSMYGRNVPQPDEFYCYRWTEDPFHRGSYSNWPAGVSQYQHQNLQAPIQRLYFAGEAYSSQYYGFLQGAYTTGQNTAEAVIRCIRRKCRRASAVNHQEYSCSRQNRHS
ncbi:unnamed protein product [Rotaria sordida]|uniref:Amine oxidase domain-containing protein n=1 Tax=Rotaria sordida TaxID=392033 RepID=A0A814YY99_9BILA|nr:unnamed protein product [Rotaria sordida]CAF1517640.1 unnamed protein product [Rotaria sordida]